MSMYHSLRPGIDGSLFGEQIIFWRVQSMLYMHQVPGL
jgi:hypothetical protein